MTTIYGILDANKDEIGPRFTDYSKAYQEWKSLYDYMICFLVRWLSDSVFTVLEPRK